MQFHCQCRKNQVKSDVLHDVAGYDFYNMKKNNFHIVINHITQVCNKQMGDGLYLWCKVFHISGGFVNQVVG